MTSRPAVAASVALLITSCSSSRELPPLTALLVSDRFEVAEHMRASREMQLSGEPFAQLLGYQLQGFDRTLKLTDQYTDPATGIQRTDPLGYALAVESYEYSKQPMNNLSFESGAGLSLMYGPVLNPTNQSGDPAFDLLRDRFQRFAAESNSGGDAGTNLIVSPAPLINSLNNYGWPGLWPVFSEFSLFDPFIQPSAVSTPGHFNTCTFGGQSGAFSYGALVPAGTTLIANYECDYNSLNLPDRDGQVVKTLEPDALGYAAWKQGLWIINYWQSLQDTAANAITLVAPADLPMVGQPGNSVVGFYVNPADPTGESYDAGAPGVYLGDIPMEGWQGLTMQEEIDNKAQFLLNRLLSADGVTLTGASSILAAIDYSYDSPLLYFPQSVAVIETPTTTSTLLETKYFPQPTAFAIADGSSHLAGLSGLLGGFSEAFAFTDRNNSQVGGSVPFLATYDGDPFPSDDGLPDGEATLHDRALGVLKIALIDLDRLHFDPGSQVLVDTASVADGGISRGTLVTTVELCESVLALRNAYRSLNGSLQLYSNDTPDTVGAPSALDSAPLTGASYAGSLSSHIAALIRMEGSFLVGSLVTADGAVANSFDLSTQTADPSPTDLASEAAAIRALLEVYLVTSEEPFRDLSTLVYEDLSNRFWMADVSAYRTTAGVDSPMQYTPQRFGLLHGALRQYTKLVASEPARQAEKQEVLQRIKRMFKLVVNGWNDVNGDDRIQYPEECLAARLEMAERALTGELGQPQDLGDRDSDCVKELSTVFRPAALASEVDLVRQ